MPVFKANTRVFNLYAKSLKCQLVFCSWNIHAQNSENEAQNKLNCFYSTS